MTNVLISVIIPVYKVEAYLDRCVRSVVDQTYQNLEIILVDDGSPDNCGTMCDAWAEKDRRIKVIHKKNGGSSAARNTALDMARGELIAFVDSDDYIAPGMLTHLHELICSGADIAECAYVCTDGNNADFDLSRNSVRTFDVCDAMREHINNHIFQQVIWNKIYRRGVIGDIRFPVGKKIDDEYFTYQVIGNAKTLVRSEKVCYAYRQQPDSIMHTAPVLSWFLGIEAKVCRHVYVLEHFPQLEGISLKSIIEGCLYLNQLAKRTADSQTRTALLEKTATVMKQYPLNQAALASMTGKERFWLSMAAWNMSLTCCVRNLLGIGL